MLERFERFALAISMINKYFHKLSAEEMERYGLKGPHCIYLLALARNPDGLTAPQLGEICGKDKADVSRMMKILEEKGMVYKDGGHQNRYGGIFLLTQLGLEAADHVRQRARQVVEYAGREWTEQQRVLFYGTLDSLVEKLSQLSKDGIPTI